jgi:hypothetical protein
MVKDLQCSTRHAEGRGKDTGSHRQHCELGPTLVSGRLCKLGVHGIACTVLEAVPHLSAAVHGSDASILAVLALKSCIS